MRLLVLFDIIASTGQTEAIALDDAFHVFETPVKCWNSSVTVEKLLGCKNDTHATAPTSFSTQRLQRHTKVLNWTQVVPFWLW